MEFENIDPKADRSGDAGIRLSSLDVATQKERPGQTVPATPAPTVHDLLQWYAESIERDGGPKAESALEYETIQRQIESLPQKDLETIGKIMQALRKDPLDKNEMDKILDKFKCDPHHLERLIIPVTLGVEHEGQKWFLRDSWDERKIFTLEIDPNVNQSPNNNQPGLVFAETGYTFKADGLCEPKTPMS